MSITDLHTYPMGPEVRTWLGIKDDHYQGHSNLEPSTIQRQNFVDAILNCLSQNPVTDSEKLLNLVDELTAMGFANLGLSCIDKNQNYWQRENFRSAHTEGIGSMLVGELDRAAQCFSLAQQANPSEPASYTNLVKILLNRLDLKSAWIWALSGLEHCPNHYPLWEQVHLLCEQDDKTTVNPTIEELAKRYDSWVGTSLRSGLGPMSESKSSMLEPFFARGERDEGFLIEYTGSLGEDERFDEIGRVIWQARESGNGKLHWRLALHGAQASLASAQHETFLKDGDVLLKNPELPAAIKEELQSLLETIREEIAEQSKGEKDSERRDLN